MIDEQDLSTIPLLKSADPRITVGRFTYGDPQLLLWAEEERIDIGAFCSIAPEVVIFGGGEHNVHWVTTYPLSIVFGLPMAGKDGHPNSKGRTLIGNDVWIAYGATILSGVSIGDGAVIGARAVVTRDVPPYAIVAGNPARVLRSRFDEETVAKLLKIAWWNWPVSRILRHVPALCGGSASDFTKAVLACDS